MQIDLTPQIINRLVDEFKFKTQNQHLREGVCPQCGKKSLWTWLEKPGMVQCNRTNNCNWQMTSKELFPDLFENLNKKYPPTPEDPNQTAKVYLQLVRGINPDLIHGWFEQGKYWHPSGDKGTASVRFYLDEAKTVMWERLIDDINITAEDGSVETRNKNFKGGFRGLWWQPPGFEINAHDEIYWCEGILDAIALNLNGFKAVAIMSSGTFPEEAIKAHLAKKVTWIIALDNDKTGRKCLKKHAKKLRELNQKVGAALSSESDSKKDWNDLHKLGQLTETEMNQYRYLGRLELAENTVEKALAMWKHNPKKNYFLFVFANSTYSFSIDAEEYKKAFDLCVEHTQDTYKAERDAFLHSSKIKEIATFKMDFLYFQQPDNGEEGQYFFRFNFSNKAPEVQLPFAGKTFGGAGDFKKSVMQKTPSALFTGSTKDLDTLYQGWMGSIPRIVKTLDYVGYDRDSGAYVFNEYAVENSKILELNAESFFQLRKTGIKSTVDIKQKLSTKMLTHWLDDFQTAFGVGGLVALSWWFGCLFVEQIREKYQHYPFFEVVGEAGSGKSDMVDFLWKLMGREGESFNPNSSTLAGRTRKMAEVSNMPVVFNETDNEKQAEERHQKMFNWDDQKDLFSGELGRVTGVRSQDNSTKKLKFKAGLMIVQNIPVAASEAIMSRIVHLQFDRSHHSPAGKKSSETLNDLAITDVSGFLLHSVQKADLVLEKFEAHFQRHRKTLQHNPRIKMTRILENHAKIMAFADCLEIVLPISRDTIYKIQANVISMAETRQEVMNDEHKIINEFWSIFEYLDSAQDREHLLNHSCNPEKEIAVNLPHFRQVCAEMKQELIDSAELKRHLVASKKRQFKKTDAIRSRILSRTVRCWIFER